VRGTTADCPQEPAQDSADLNAVRPLCRPQYGGYEAAVTIEDHDRLKAVFVIVRIEEAQLLAAMHRIESVIYVDNDPFRNLLERPAIEVDHGAPHAHQGANIGKVFKPRDRRLRTEVAIGGSEVERQF
jgi:hypothetical protein